MTTNFEKITKDVDSLANYICDNIPNCYQVCRFYPNIKCRKVFKQWLQQESEE